MKYKDCVDGSGVPTDLGIRQLKELRDSIDGVLGDHVDNTLQSCRVDLDGHDCCYICNDVEVALRAYVLGQEDSCTS